jgi:prepilin-type N-terminal cleavage/methylation domain-containing protein
LSRRGFSLIEVMIAGAMFAVGTAGILSGWFMLNSTIDTLQRSADALVVAEDVLEALRLQPRGGPDLTDGSHARYFTRDRQESEVVVTGGYTVAWEVSVPASAPSGVELTYRQLNLDVRWTGLDRREHVLNFVTMRPR